MQRVFSLFVSAIFTILICPAPASAQPACEQPEAVCDARASVFAISAFDPLASAVRLDEDTLVTVRHAVADATSVDILLEDGTRRKAAVIPTAFVGDLILLRTDDLPPGPVAMPGEISVGEEVYTVGADVTRRTVIAYDSGSIQSVAAAENPRARLHHFAYSQPGNSGGALVSEDGTLIGIIASGGEGRFEAIPAKAIDELRTLSGPEHAEVSAETGAATRICTIKLDEARVDLRGLHDSDAKAIETSCRRSNNRQNLDLAAQALATSGRLDAAITLQQDAVALDPEAVNTRLGLAISLHIATRYEDALPHLHLLMEDAGEDPHVLRLSIQAGTWGGDSELAERAYQTLTRVNPQMAPAAKRFLDAPPPRPAPRRTR